VVGFCENDDEPSDSLKTDNFSPAEYLFTAYGRPYIVKLVG
jgi:hypothetical protein